MILRPRHKRTNLDSGSAAGFPLRAGYAAGFFLRLPGLLRLYGHVCAMLTLIVLMFSIIVLGVRFDLRVMWQMITFDFFHYEIRDVKHDGRTGADVALVEVHTHAEEYRGHQVYVFPRGLPAVDPNTRTLEIPFHLTPVARMTARPRSARLDYENGCYVVEADFSGGGQSERRWPVDTVELCFSLRWCERNNQCTDQ